MARAQVEVPIVAGLTRAAFEKIAELTEGDDPPAKKIEATVNGILQDLCEGGLVLSGDDVKRLEDSIEPVDAASIIEAVEAGASMDAGQSVVKWRVDPTLVGPLQDIANSQGMSVDEVTQNLMDNAVGQGWFYQFNPQPHTLFIPQADHNRLAALLGKEHVTGADVISLLEEKGILEEENELAGFLRPDPAAEIVAAANADL